jgi:uncharacterized protein DUF5946
LVVLFLGSRFDVPDAYETLYADMIQHGDAAFTLQYVVDAHAAQTATPHAKPISVAFALVGLYLHVEKGYSGRQVQRVHMRMARNNRPWPHVQLPVDRGAVTAATALEATPGSERDKAIESWCRSVWDAFRDSRGTIVELLRTCGIV